MEKWNIVSSDEPGFHEVIKPNRESCDVVHVFRLNLRQGETYTINTGELEMLTMLLKGKAFVKAEYFEEAMEKYDSFYLKGRQSAQIFAEADAVFYIGGAVCEGYGSPYFRKYNDHLPVGELYQVHGEGSCRRGCYFALDPKTPASRLMCGVTWGGDGSWTSWPAHQHEKDLEEAYCYFDMDPPEFGIQLTYLYSGPENLMAHIVRSGNMVYFPQGYHPSVAAPGSRNIYFWVLASFSHQSRRYDLSISDPLVRKD